MKLALVLGLVLSFVHCSNGQCEIKNRINADQTMYYYLEPEVFYHTEQNTLKGSITTDKDHYFLQLMPAPFPAKGSDVKLNKDVEVKVSGSESFKLENYDVRYRRTDTTLALMYLIPKDKVSFFLEQEVEWVNIDMGDEKGPRHYIFVLHKATLREQLKCLIEMK